MEKNDQLPETNRDYPESDISDNQQKQNDPDNQDQQKNKSDEVKDTGADIENLPEIKPARVGILG